MYAFLSRLGRLFIGITVLVAVIAIFGVSTDLGTLVSHRGNASMACTVSSAGVGQQLLVSGQGFAANTQYHLFVNTPTASFETVANADATGAFTYENWAYTHGSYGASVWPESGASKPVATCSSTTL